MSFKIKIFPHALTLVGSQQALFGVLENLIHTGSSNLELCKKCADVLENWWG